MSLVDSDHIRPIKAFKFVLRFGNPLTVVMNDEIYALTIGLNRGLQLYGINYAGHEVAAHLTWAQDVLSLSEVPVPKKDKKSRDIVVLHPYSGIQYVNGE